MTRQNSTLTLSNPTFSDQRFAAGHESSPKNDISLFDAQVGFIQLIDRESQQVLAQREGVNEQACFDHLKENVWNVSESLIMKFVAQSEVVHPVQFFRALPKTAVVKVYHNQLTNHEPVDETPVWEGLAAQIEENKALIEREQWDAFDVQGNWIGTSEY